MKSSNLAPSATVLLALAACATPGGPPLFEIAPRINATLESQDVVLGPGDSIGVVFPLRVELNQEVTIQPDGYATFLFVDRMHVAGLRPDQLDERLTEAYGSEVDSPELSVDVVELAERSVSMLGEVKTPSVVEVAPDGRLSLVEAFARVGGPRDDTGYLASTVLVRWDADAQVQRTWIFDATPETWQGPNVLYLQPWDVVYVPPKPVVRVSTWLDLYIRRLIPFPRIFPVP